MAYTQRELQTYQQYGPITSYGARGAGGDQAAGSGAWGVYQTDGPAAERIRNLNDTIAAAGLAATQNQVGVPAGQGVQRTAPITEAEMQLVAETAEADKARKWEQYWWDGATPGQPWTLTELAKIDPNLIGRKMDAMRQTSQLALDATILKHLGHGGDPQLAHLQYMMDQKMIDVPSMVQIMPREYTAGPFSVIAQQGSHVDAAGRYSDRGLYPQRAFTGDARAGGPTWTPNQQNAGGRAIAGALGGQLVGQRQDGVWVEGREGVNPFHNPFGAR